jgi:UDP-N-acetyl-D-glucosamine dehydrogenase
MTNSGSASAQAHFSRTSDRDSKIGISVWNVIDAAKTKQFGFIPFYPGAGLGGHCIPIDSFYSTCIVKEYGILTRFIKLAGELNTMAPHHVVEKLIDALSRRKQRALSGVRILMLGIASRKTLKTREKVLHSPLLKRLRDVAGLLIFITPSCKKCL